MTQRRTGAFDGFDFDGFWDSHAYSQNYNEPVPSDEQIAAMEQELGFRLPDAWVELARLRNGGGVERSCYPMKEATCWAEDHIAITGIYAIGRTARYSLFGNLGWTFMRDEWGYPSWGVGIADTPSGGHEMIMLDYRECGPQGEPGVVHVHQEGDYEVTPVAPDFATFIRGLVTEDVYDDSAEVAAEALERVRTGTLSPIVIRALQASSPELPDGEAVLRKLAERLVQAKGSFTLHADAHSWLMYDAIFWLYSQIASASSFKDYFDRAEGQLDYGRACHTLMLRSSFVAQPYGFNTGGYAEGFVQEWWNARVQQGEMALTDGNYRFTPDFESQLLGQLRALSAA